MCRSIYILQISLTGFNFSLFFSIFIAFILHAFTQIINQFKLWSKFRHLKLSFQLMLFFLSSHDLYVFLFRLLQYLILIVILPLFFAFFCDYYKHSMQERSEWVPMSRVIFFWKLITKKISSNKLNWLENSVWIC